eukprot:gene1723-16206_t
MLVYLLIQIENRWLHSKSKLLQENPATFAEVSFMLTELHVPLVTLFVITAQKKDILLKSVNPQRRVLLSMQYISLHSARLQPPALQVLDMLQFQFKSMIFFNLTALIDSCSSENFISEKAFKRLQIPATPSDKKVTMAMTSMESSIIGQCNVKIVLNGNTHKNVRLDILKSLCSDVILGYDFQKQHKNLTFQFGGNKEDLIVSSSFPKTVSALDTKQPISPLIANVADVDPPTSFKTAPGRSTRVCIKLWSPQMGNRSTQPTQMNSFLEALEQENNTGPCG